MRYVSIFDEIEGIRIEKFRDLRKKLKESDTFFTLIAAPKMVTHDEKQSFAKILIDYGIDENALRDDEALENAAWAIMRRSTLVD